MADIVSSTEPDQAPVAGKPSPDSESSVRFLKQFAPDGPWILAALRPEGGGPEVKTFGRDSEVALRGWINKYNGRRNLYFQVNPSIHALSKKATKTDIKSLAWLHIDIDPKDDEDIAAEQKLILAQLSDNCPESIPDPTCVIFSGGGYQAFWRLEEPVPIDGDLAKAAEAECYNTQLEITFGADSCHNVDRIMRLPGTINLPDARKIKKGRSPALAKLISFDDVSYPISLFSKAEAEERSDCSGSNGDNKKVEIPEEVERITDLTQLNKWSVQDRVKIIIADGRNAEEGPKQNDDSRSAWLFDVLCSLVRRVVPDEIVYSIITDPRWRISESVLENGRNARSYAIGQIKSAREKVNNEALVLSENTPLESAREFIARNRPTLMHYNDDWLAYNGSAYTALEDETIQSELYLFLEKARKVDSKGQLHPFNPRKSIVANVVDAMIAPTHIPRESYNPPCWLKGSNPPANEIVACENGLLHLPTGELHKPTSDFFTRNSLDFPFDKDAPEPRHWLEFLETLWRDDRASINTLQEIFGYLLIPDTSQQKMFLLVGPPRSGKGTIARVLTSLVGKHNTCAPTLNTIGENFGLEPLIGKQLAFVSDMRLGRKTDHAAIAENLLRISGEDMVTANRKYKRAWHGRLSVRFLIMTNLLPRFIDAGGALANRFIPLVMTESFLGREDHRLFDRLVSDLPGILNWSIAGWRRLSKRGHFELPGSAADAMQDLADMASPVSAFIRDECEVGPGHSIAKAELFEAWQTWCQSRGQNFAGTMDVFSRDLMAAEPGRVKPSKKRMPDSRVPVFLGIRLKTEPIQEEISF